MKYAVIGAGGMGVQYGVLLQEFAGKQVDFIDAWEPNVTAIRKQGGVYVSQDDENRHLVPIKVFYPEEYDGEPDVWIIFLKQHQLEGMLKRCAHLFRPGQIVFSAMNGYGHFEKIAQYFPDDHIYGGTALIGAFVYGPGDVNFTGGAHAKAMSMCAYDGHVSDVEHELHDDFAAVLNQDSGAREQQADLVEAAAAVGDGLLGAPHELRPRVHFGEHHSVGTSC